SVAALVDEPVTVGADAAAGAGGAGGAAAPHPAVIALTTPTRTALQNTLAGRFTSASRIVGAR
ncbi:MAG: hypothetical protein LC797_15400, partial [Chloroflexi bacterium]|nr:hypothetical protein [Chloroflexota bacterium]